MIFISAKPFKPLPQKNASAIARTFDMLCLRPVKHYTPADIRALRERENVSQPVFALYLNVSKKALQKWERGEAQPDSAAMKLLSLVEHNGLALLG